MSFGNSWGEKIREFWKFMGDFQAWAYVHNHLCFNPKHSMLWAYRAVMSKIHYKRFWKNDRMKRSGGKTIKKLGCEVAVFISKSKKENS